MRIEDMKRIAAARTKGEWGYCYDGSDTFSIGLKNDPQFPQICSIYSRDMNPSDAEFIMMASNQWDDLMAVVEASKIATEAKSTAALHRAIGKLNYALQAFGKGYGPFTEEEYKKFLESQRF